MPLDLGSLKQAVESLKRVLAKSRDSGFMAALDQVGCDAVTRRELFRLAAESRLIEDVEQWMRYHDSRNQTPQTYEPAAAQRVYQMIPPFTREAPRLLEALVARND